MGMISPVLRRPSLRSLRSEGIGRVDRHQLLAGPTGPLTTYGYPGDLESLFIHHGDRKPLPAIILRKLRGEHGPVRYGFLSRGESRSRVVRISAAVADMEIET